MADSLGGQESDPRKEKSEWSIRNSRVLVFSYSSVSILTAMLYLFTDSDLTDGSRACTKPVSSAVLCNNCIPKHYKKLIIELIDGLDSLCWDSMDA